MFPTSVLDRFIEQCPAAVMVRATLEHLLRPERLDQIFAESSERQYEQQLLFSQLVALMSGVATRTHSSVHAAYLAARERLGVSPAALYGKLNRLEPGTSAALIRETAGEMATVIDAMPRARRAVLPGFRVQYLDGNHLAATEHRLAELRTTREGPLPGQTLALLDAQRDVIAELIVCEDGHAQERSLLPELLERIAARTVVVADRNFCTTSFLFGLTRRHATFVIRQHASTLSWNRVGRCLRRGRGDTGILSEQAVEVTAGDATMRLRRITVKLDTPTENGDTEIHLLSSLPPRVSAAQVAAVYRSRWTIEGAFQSLTDVLRCEVRTLGYPKAALFAFAVAVLAYNSYAVVKAALRSAHGAEAVEQKLSEYHLLHDVVATTVGMDIAVEPRAWDAYAGLSVPELAKALVRLAKRVKLARYPKKKRGPKKPRPPRKSGRKNHHIATARILAASRGRAC
jgi:IS4 transposase